MGISSFPSAAEGGVLPVLVMNTVLSVALLKNLLRSLLQIMGADWSPQDLEGEPAGFSREVATERRISFTQFKSLNCGGGGGNGGFPVECCVCLSGFEEEEEVSELDCKHFFHKRCLDKWFDNKHSTCPLCRSIILH